MRKGILTIALAFMTVFTFAQKVELSNQEVTWEGNKPGGSHNGTVSISDYALDVKGEALSGEFTIDLNTLKSLDLEGEWKDKLEGHLKSPDFFDTAKYPTAKFVLSETVKAGDGYLLIGKLTIKDVTKDVVFPAEIEFTKGSFKATSTFEIDRTDYGVEYGNEGLAAQLKDKFIYNDMKLGVTLQGNF